MSRLLDAIKFELRFMGDKADIRAPNLYHTCGEMLEMIIEYAQIKDWDECVCLLDKLQSEMCLKELYESRLRLIELRWRIIEEYRYE